MARTAVLNNNYVQRGRLQIPGVSTPYPRTSRAPDRRRPLLARGAAARDRRSAPRTLGNRIADFGMPGHWTSHHPFDVARAADPRADRIVQPAELDELADVYARVVRRGVRGAGHDRGGAAPVVEEPDAVRRERDPAGDRTTGPRRQAASPAHHADRPSGNRTQTGGLNDLRRSLVSVAQSPSREPWTRAVTPTRPAATRAACGGRSVAARSFNTGSVTRP